ncbi:MAG: NPCBM/NEW2 domain-containing protein [Phycisphaerae bacterium]|nr:NPCBM/NEW2 domain-containing protein [Phycisphaerae bacterium]
MSILTEKDKLKLRGLVACSVSGELDAAGTHLLEKSLRHSSEARQYYIECLGLYTDLYDLMGHRPDVAAPFVSAGPGRVLRLWRVWTAALLSAAAVLVIALWFLFSTGPLGPEVATLVDALNVSASRSFPTQSGQRLHLGQGRQRLKHGLAHIRFDRGVDAVLEGPCSFEILSDTALRLSQGRVFVRVDESGKGFQVKTAHADLVDLGTEFGVLANHRDTQLFVIKGEVEVHTEKPAQTTTLPVVRQKEAVQISDKGRSVRRQPFVSQLFARGIDSLTGIIWRGERTVDLADLVSGGNGFGTGRLGCELNPLTGGFGPIKSLARDRLGDYQYHKVPTLACVDGVFVPDGELGPVIVTSEGHLFEECPDTCNIFFSEILGCSMTFKGPVAGQSRGLILNGLAYGREGRPGIFMHANLGLTFDLGAIGHGLVSHRAIQRFESVVGISEETNAPHLADADMWVLIDGRLVWSRRSIRVGQTQHISVPIPPESQFLTLVTTDSHSRTDRVDTFADWCVFGNPRLILE